MTTDYVSRSTPPKPRDAAPDADTSTTGQALAEHRAAVEAWLKSPSADRPHHWRAVEAAWRKCKQLGASLDASKQAAALMRADGKIRSIA